MTLTLGSMTTASSLRVMRHPPTLMQHNGAHPQESHRETHGGDSVTVRPRPPHDPLLRTPTCLPYPPPHRPGSQGSEVSVAFRPGQQGALGPAEALRTVSMLHRAAVPRFPTEGPREVQCQLRVTQPLSEGQGPGPRPGSTRQCALLRSPPLRQKLGALS